MSCRHEWHPIQPEAIWPNGPQICVLCEGFRSGQPEQYHPGVTPPTEREVAASMGIDLGRAVAAVKDRLAGR